MHLKEENRFILRGVRLSPLPLKANKTCTTIELSMVPDLLIGNFKTHRFDVELLCSIQVFEVELNTDESCLNTLRKILSGFEYSAAGASEKPHRRERAEQSHIKANFRHRLLERELQDYLYQNPEVLLPGEALLEKSQEYCV